MAVKQQNLTTFDSFFHSEKAKTPFIDPKIAQGVERKKVGQVSWKGSEIFCGSTDISKKLLRISLRNPGALYQQFTGEFEK